MPVVPPLKLFAELAADVDYVPVYRRLISDSLTPVSAFQKLDLSSAACLFESVIGGEKVGRYSFLASEPFLQIKAAGTKVTVSRRTQPNDRWESETSESPNPLETLRAEVKAMNVCHLPELPPFIGGAVGYAGYDTVRYVEHLPDAPHDDRQLPDLWFALYDHMIVFDHVQKTLIVLALANVRDKHPDALHHAYDDASRQIDRLIAWLESPPEASQLADIDLGGELALDYSSNMTPTEYEDAVRKCVEYIRAGDIFQVVISQRLQTPLEIPPFELYRTLRVVNPSPFMFYLRTPDVTLVGSSPEIMVRVVDGHVTVRPLAGTRPRGKTDDEDRRLADELLADPKERAEHVMLVDLGRNDVGRVAAVRHGRTLRRDGDRTLQPRDAHHVQRHAVSCATSATPSTRSPPACRPAPSPAPPRCGRWRSSTNSNRTAAAPTPAPSATSISPATWTPASPSVRS